MRGTGRTRSRPLAQLMWKKVSSEFRSVFGVDDAPHMGHMMSVKQSVLDGTSKWSAKIAITGLWPARCDRRPWPVLHPSVQRNDETCSARFYISLYISLCIRYICVPPMCLNVLLLLLLLLNIFCLPDRPSSVSPYAPPRRLSPFTLRIHVFYLNICLPLFLDPLHSAVNWTLQAVGKRN